MQATASSLSMCSTGKVFMSKTIKSSKKVEIKQNRIGACQATMLFFLEIELKWMFC